MNPKSRQNLLLFPFLCFSSIHFPGFLCQEYETCSRTFQCANITNISYPFWGGRRPPSCGHPGFGLNCQGDVPILAMSPLSFRVLEIHFSTYTLQVAREDLWNNTCPAVLHNTTLNSKLFEIPPDSNYKNVSLYFDCTTDQAQQRTLPNQFSCGSNETINLFKSGDVSMGPGADFTCNQNISVPVTEDAATALEVPIASSRSVLRAALATGFSIQWSADDADCVNCVRSGGACGYNSNSGSSVCYTRREASVGSGNPHTGEAPQAQGMPPDGSPLAPPFLPRKTGSHNRILTLLGLIVGVIGIIVAFILICWCCWCCKRWCSPKDPIDPNVEQFLWQQGSLAPRRYRYSEIKKITKSFNNKLGQGGFGSVYKGMLPDGSHVAVKVLVEMDSDGEEFLNEVASISRTSHVNIVNLLGFCYERNKRALVFEYMPNRSLDKFISKDRSIDCLDMEKLFKIVVGVAKGLEYLHMGCNTRIVHFDIKPQNILLDEDFCPKISDFGLAKLCKKKQSILSVLGTRGTIGYIAPEVFSRNFGGVSHRSDVYSYGMMVLEMVGAKNMVETETIQSSENYFPDKIYEQVILAGTRNVDDSMIEEEDERARKIYLVGFWCIQTIPSDRPSMSRVVEMLEGNLQSIQIPPKPFLFNPRQSGQELSPSLSVGVETENSTEG